MGENKIIHNFKKYSIWVSTLKEMKEELWTIPISQEKWTVGEIISHIMNWDEYLLSEILPSVRKGQGMEFPDFDTYNKIASNYAKSGISKKKLIEEAKNKRELLVKELSLLSADKLNEHVTANGVVYCPHTGTPYSLIYIIKEFVDHDNHHKRQVTQFLNENHIQNPCF
ncbi:DinB family protein [Bacillus clarus]|uniref:DinB family protein n=1 Tax=Bacillus clarus TaxID=2338372 RepID=A0A090YLM0_9BACI|nr:DinB family protein [Bacillus clarus]KFM98837.1 dinB superfamily protein [Bacillus clarus]RFT63257.1 DinB family protein [Bacillus clarus]